MPDALVVIDMQGWGHSVPLVRRATMNKPFWGD